MFLDGETNYTKIANQIGATRQSVSKYHAKWRSESVADTQDIVKIKEDIALKAVDKTIGEVTDELLHTEELKGKATEIVNIAFEKLFKIINNKNNLLKESDISKIIKVLQTSLPYVLDKANNDNGEPKTNNYFIEQFTLHHKINSKDNEQDTKTIDIGHTEEQSSRNA